MTPQYVNHDVWKPLLFALDEPRDKQKPPASILEEWTISKTFSQYFEDWITEAEKDGKKGMYRKIHDQAQTDANSLQQALAKKLGKKLNATVKP